MESRSCYGWTRRDSWTLCPHRVDKFFQNCIYKAFYSATMIVEIEDWRTLRLNGMKMGLPFENSEIRILVYCGSMQLQSRDGLVLTLNKDGQVSTTPPGTEESCPHHIPPAWNHGKDFNDGRCKRPTDCIENPTCRDHPKDSQSQRILYKKIQILNWPKVRSSMPRRRMQSLWLPRPS